MSFWSDFSTALEKAITAAGAQVKAAEQYFGPKILAGAEEVATIALNAALAQAPAVLSGSEKLSAATSSVVSTLAASGKSVAVNIAETAVQAAVNRLSTPPLP